MGFLDFLGGGVTPGEQQLGRTKNALQSQIGGFLAENQGIPPDVMQAIQGRFLENLNRFAAKQRGGQVADLESRGLGRSSLISGLDIARQGQAADALAQEQSQLAMQDLLLRRQAEQFGIGALGNVANIDAQLAAMQGARRQAGLGLLGSLLGIGGSLGGIALLRK